jgi:hypothetical protein
VLAAVTSFSVACLAWLSIAYRYRLYYAFRTSHYGKQQFFFTITVDTFLRRLFQSAPTYLRRHHRPPDSTRSHEAASLVFPSSHPRVAILPDQILRFAPSSHHPPKVSRQDSVATASVLGLLATTLRNRRILLPLFYCRTGRLKILRFYAG